MSHLAVAGGNPQYLLFNHEEVLEKLEAYPGVVAMVLSHGDGDGSYERGARGIHHLQPVAVTGLQVRDRTLLSISASFT